MFEFIKKRKLAKVTRLALKDGILSDVEKKNLANEADRLGLNHNEINRVRLNDYQNRVGPILEKVINARRMRVVELERIYEIADNLGIEPELSSDLDKCWQLRCWDDGETLDLPTCASSILLKSGEFCFLEIQD